jgi:hypothetical protein
LNFSILNLVTSANSYAITAFANFLLASIVLAYYVHANPKTMKFKMISPLVKHIEELTIWKDLVIELVVALDLQEGKF